MYDSVGQKFILCTINRACPCSSMSGTKSSIGFGGRGVKALCGRATSWGQSSADGTPTTLLGENETITTVEHSLVMQFKWKRK